MSHTKGEWTAHDHALGPYVTAPSPSGGLSRITVAACVHPVDAFSTHQRVANARLIAAAPELLEACKSALDWLGECTPGTVQAEIADELRAAIAKANGGKI